MLTEIFVNGKKKITARLLARGYNKDSSEILKDSRTFTEESKASNWWTCNSIDIKPAFLQEKKNRVVYLTPPPEFEEKDIVLKWNTCIYGLSDASWGWYLCVKEELDKLWLKCSRFEPALFFWHFSNELQGLLITHVDDFCWGSTKKIQNNSEWQIC